MDVSVLSDTQFKIMVIRMLMELMGRVDELNFNREIVSIKKDTEAIKKNQLEMKNIITNEEYPRRNQ